MLVKYSILQYCGQQFHVHMDIMDVGGQSGAEVDFRKMGEV